MLPINFVSVCQFNPPTGGAGDFVVATAAPGYLTPAAAGVIDGATYRYRAESIDLTQWEVGYGIYTSGALARSTILKSSNGNAKVSFINPPGVAIVFLAEDAMSSQNNLADVQNMAAARANIGVNPNVVSVTMAASYAAGPGDDFIIVGKPTGSPTTVTMVGAATRTRGPVQIKDGNGDAALHNITVQFSNNEKADGLSTVVIRTAYGVVSLAPNPAGGWVILNFG